MENALPRFATKLNNGYSSVLLALQDAAVDAWTRECEMYARYFGTLARARKPAEIFEAGSELLSAHVNALASRTDALKKCNDVIWPFAELQWPPAATRHGPATAP